jgi:hypothetical protein
MAFKNKVTTIPAVIYQYCILLVSIAGFVPKHATVPRAIAIVSSIAFSWILSHQYQDNSSLGIGYFVISEILYLGFLFLVLTENGYRHWFIKRWGNEEDGYLAFEAVLGFIFFHNAAGIGFITSTNPGQLFDFMSRELLVAIVIIMSFAGFIIKVWSAKVVSIEIYYWKDMFLGKKVCEFVVTGPYKFLSNPMYGIGQLQAYAFAIYYESAIGLLAAFVNQLLIFTFY